LENNIKMDVKEIKGRAWAGLSWLRLEVNGGVVNRRVP
jgi:hypothetical protein